MLGPAYAGANSAVAVRSSFQLFRVAESIIWRGRLESRPTREHRGAKKRQRLSNAAPQSTATQPRVGEMEIRVELDSASGSPEAASLETKDIETETQQFYGRPAEKPQVQQPSPAEASQNVGTDA